jgi:transposase
MWNTATRGRMVAIEKKTKRYPSDLTEEEWVALEVFLPQPAQRGRRRTTDLREVVNALRYMVRSGCEWRMLPIHFPPWQTVYWWFRRFVRLLLFRTIHDVVLMIDRERVGREASPTAGVIDSQTVKAPMAEKRGYDANKKIVGRKRHIAVDTDGRLLSMVTIFRQASRQSLLRESRMKLILLIVVIGLLFGGGGYYGERVGYYGSAAFGGIGLVGIILIIATVMLASGRS